MNKWVFFLLLILSSTLVGQSGLKIPRKFRGEFLGTQAPYTVDFRTNFVQFDSVQVSIKLEKERVTICYLGADYCPVSAGPIYALKKENSGKNTQWLLTVEIPGSMVKEELWLVKKNLHVIRKGVYPQPEVKLIKSRKK